MFGPKSGNKIDGGTHNVQTGPNSGTISIGVTFEQHEAALEKALARKKADLERAHGAEKALLQREIDELRNKLLNAEGDYRERLTELADLKVKLARYDNSLDRQKFEAALAAIDRDDTTLAEALFKELAAKASERSRDAEREEAEIYFELGKLAEARVRWADAAEHYARAARLDPNYDTLIRAGELLWRAGRYAEAIRHNEQLVDLAKCDFGAECEQTAAALNNLALSYQASGRYDKAEPLYREALEIDRKTLGVEHPTYANHLNNLAGLLWTTGRQGEAEPLFREALEIVGKTLGVEHPDYTRDLNNLAGLLQATGRYGEAEPLFREVLEIDRKTLGVEHPDYARDLNNLAGLLHDTGRHDESEPLYREALAVAEAGLGPDHPNTQLCRENLKIFLAQKPG